MAEFLSSLLVEGYEVVCPVSYWSFSSFTEPRSVELAFQHMFQGIDFLTRWEHTFVVPGVFTVEFPPAPVLQDQISCAEAGDGSSLQHPVVVVVGEDFLQC